MASEKLTQGREQFPPPQSPASSLGDDMLEGAKAIGAYLGWPVRKVWRARDEGWSIPIRKAEGIGIYAFRSELDAYLRGDATLAPPKVA